MSFSIRPESRADAEAIRTLTEAAFRDMPFADGDEQDVVDRLRAVGALELSLVATLGSEVVGQITFSPAAAHDGSGPWFGLGPVSVLPGYQRRGIGSALIEQGLDLLRSRGALGSILTGNPEYYARFGFVLSPGSAPVNEPAEYFMVKTFAVTVPPGPFRFHDAFYGAV